MRRVATGRLLRPLSSLPNTKVENLGISRQILPPSPQPHLPKPSAFLPVRASQVSKPEVTVDLAYERYGPDVGSRGGVNAMVIVPGLLASAELWRTHAKTLAQRLGVPVYALSLRNHGTSPHQGPMTHYTMAGDVLAFCRRHGLSRISLLGHSLGAKVTMAMALRRDLPPDLVENVIIGDSAPVDRLLDANVSVFLDGMQEVERRNLRSREDAIEVLQRYTKTKLETKFLLTNLVLKASGNPADPAVPLRFRVPIDIHRRAIEPLARFPFKSPDAQWKGKILFLKGSESEHLNAASIAASKLVFPNMELKTLQGGHWLPFDNPKDFILSTITFLSPR